MNDHPEFNSDGQLTAFRSLITSLEVADEAVCELCQMVAGELSEDIADNHPGNVVFALVAAEIKHRLDGLNELLSETDKAFELFSKYEDAEDPAQAFIGLIAIREQLDRIEITFEEGIKLSAGIKPKQ